MIHRYMISYNLSRAINLGLIFSNISPTTNTIKLKCGSPPRLPNNSVLISMIREVSFGEREHHVFMALAAEKSCPF